MINRMAPSYWIVIVRIVLVGVCVFKQEVASSESVRSLDSSEPSFSMKGDWITANPLDLSVVIGMSKFRSCAGHDYSGLNTDGERETERSMKHYIVTSVPWKTERPKQGYAPFDGRVVKVQNSGNRLGFKVILVPDAAPQWLLTFAHVDSLVSEGQIVKAGEPIVTYPPKDISAVPRETLPPTVAFDMVVETNIPEGWVRDSFLLHMIPSVLEEYVKKGFDPERLIISKAERDAHPCYEYNRSEKLDYIYRK